jgi:ParB-like chromosome segregation protein Spo0J
MAPRKPAAKPESKAPAAKPSKAAPEASKDADEGYQLARKDAVKYLHGRRQAMFALARRYHLDAEDVEQEGYEVLLTCLRDFNPTHTKKDGEKITVQFNTFFGSRLEGKALELRNRDPEYQARQAHMSEMSEADKAQFRKDPPLLVQHLDQETAVQEHLRGEVASAKRASTTNVALKVLQDSFVEKKLNQLIAQERDDKRRAALLHVKVGGVSSFDEIAYHFGVTDSRASQILNELMDAFYVQRLLDGDLKSVAYDWRKLKLQPKRAQKLLEEAAANATPERVRDIATTFAEDYPDVVPTLEGRQQESANRPTQAMASTATMARQTFADPFNAEENAKYPLQGLEWKTTAELNPLIVPFRNPAEDAGHEAPHITGLMDRVDDWPLIVTQEGDIIDGARRWQAARNRGKEKLLCLVRQVNSPNDAKILRIICNLRQIKADKMDLYFAISALSDLGLSQQKIATAIGTSRPNVIVYAKVKDKATPKLRALFEDGLIQITNASACVDLPVAAQDGLAEFIRRHGGQWGKGPQFNEVYEAAAAGKLAKLNAAQPEPSPQANGTARMPAPLPPTPETSSAVAAPADAASAAVVQALRQRQTSLETALRDAETWNQQREAIVNRQTQELTELRQQVDGLKRELQAHDLMKFGDEATVAGLMKEMKAFYAIVERLASAGYQLDKSAKALRGQPLTHKQTVEVQQQLDGMESTLSSLRVELSNKNRR